MHLTSRVWVWATGFPEQLHALIFNVYSKNIFWSWSFTVKPIRPLWNLCHPSKRYHPDFNAFPRTLQRGGKANCRKPLIIHLGKLIPGNKCFRKLFACTELLYVLHFSFSYSLVLLILWILVKITEKWNEKDGVCGELQQSSCTGNSGPALAECAGRPSAAHMS